MPHCWPDSATQPHNYFFYYYFYKFSACPTWLGQQIWPPSNPTHGRSFSRFSIHLSGPFPRARRPTCQYTKYTKFDWINNKYGSHSMTGRAIVPPSRGIGRDRSKEGCKLLSRWFEKKRRYYGRASYSCEVKVVLHDGIFFSITPCLLKVPTNVIQSLYLWVCIYRLCHE